MMGLSRVSLEMLSPRALSFARRRLFSLESDCYFYRDERMRRRSRCDSIVWRIAITG